MAKCASNASDLASDANLLHLQGRNARAFFLYNSAAEELAKYLMLEIVGRKLFLKVPINWPRFWERLRTHDAKMAQATVRVEACRHILGDEALDLARAGSLIWRQVGTDARNGSLYVDVEGGQLRGPADLDWELGVVALRGLVEALKLAAEEVGTTEQQIAASFTTPSAARPIAALTSEFERLKAAGTTYEEACTLHDKAWELTQPKVRKRDG